nr:ArsR family transcriptional regulator [Mesorhizobium kowhaii]
MTLVSRLRTAAHLDRLRILGLCAHADLTVCQLAEILGLRREQVVRHVRLLVRADLLWCNEQLRGLRTISKQEARTAVWFNCWSISCPTAMAIINETYNGSKRHKTRGRRGPPACS